MRLLSLVSAAPDPCGVEDFARKLAQSLPAKVPPITTGKPAPPPEDSAEPPGEGEGNGDR